MFSSSLYHQSAQSGRDTLSSTELLSSHSASTKSTVEESNRGYIPQITGIRAIAAYMVYLHHFPAGQELLPAVLFRMTLELHTGVGLFFVLSGFLIYQRYYASCRMESGWWGNYIKNRVARIYPMYVLFTVATLLNRTLRHGDASVWLWLLNLSFLRGFSELYYMSGVSQGWTLTVEECFYFSAPLMFWWMKEGWQRLSKHRFWFMLSADGRHHRTERARIVPFWARLLNAPVRFWMPLAGVYVLGGVLLACGTVLQWQGFFQGTGFMVSYTFFGRAFEFFCGMALAKFMMERSVHDSPHNPAMETRQARTAARWTWVSLLGIAGVLFAMSFLQMIKPDGSVQYSIAHPLGKTLNNLVLPVFYAMLLYGLIAEQSLVQRILASRLMVLLGKSSYIFYLIHMGIVQALVARVVCPTTFVPVTMLQYIAQFLVLNGVAVVLFLTVEDPLNHWIRRTWKTGTRTVS